MRARQPFDLATLELFVAVAEAGSMSAAARRLGLTQSAVSQRIAQLEKNIGTALVDRGLRPLGLTPAGHVLREHAERLLAEARRLPHRLRQAARLPMPPLRLGLADSLAVTCGPRLVEELRPLTAGLSVWSGLTTTLNPSFLARELDMVGTSDALEQVDGLERHHLLTERYLVLTPASWPETTTLAALLARGPLVRYSARSQVGAQIDRHLHRQGHEVARTLELDGSDTVFAMVSAGHGFAITTPLCLLQGRPWLTSARVQPLPGPSLSRSLILLARTGELPGLAERVTTLARRILATELLPQLRSLGPDLDKAAQVG